MADFEDLLQHLVFLVARQEDFNTQQTAFNAQQAAINERLTTAIEHLASSATRLEHWMARLDTLLTQNQHTQERVEILLARLLRQDANGAH